MFAHPRWQQAVSRKPRRIGGRRRPANPPGRRVPMLERLEDRLLAGSVLESLSGITAAALGQESSDPAQPWAALSSGLDGRPVASRSRRPWDRETFTPSAGRPRDVVPT